MIQFAAQGRFKARYNDPDHLKGKSRGGKASQHESCEGLSSEGASR